MSTTMELHSLLTFVATMKEAGRILIRNGRLMISIASFQILVYSFFILTSFLSLRPYIADLTVKLGFLLATSPTSPEYANLLIGMQKDIGIFLGMEWIFVATHSIITILFSTATVYASAISHREKDIISIKDLAVLTATSWKRPVVTSLYISVFGVGYIFLVLAILLPLALPGAMFATTILCIAAVLLYLYLGVIWAVGLMVSVLEEKSGIDALGKAGQLVKGMRIQGYALSLTITVILLTVSQLWRLALFKQPSESRLLIVLVVMIAMWSVSMFRLACYTVFYHECKKLHGEEITDETMVGVGGGYTKVLSLNLIGENVA